MKQLGVTCLLILSLAGSTLATGKIKFWDQQRKGTNWFNITPTRDWLVAAKAAGIQVIRLAPNNWKSKQRDFLLGSADRFDAIVQEDLQKLIEILAEANALGLKVVLTTLTLPGARYRQLNGDKPDFRLWQDQQYLPQAAQFWKLLAQRLKNNPAIVGYNILNEPVPERAAGIKDIQTTDVMSWYAKVENTAADLNRFNATIVAAIREVDKETPIVIDCGWWATAYAIEYLKSLRDDKVLYSIHMYEPYTYTNKKTNNGRFAYPGKVVVEPDGDDQAKPTEINLNRGALENMFRPVAAWQAKNKIKSNRIFVGEFGCNRTVTGAANYLSDLINIFDGYGWHWAFFTFRQDFWDGMDYELGTKPPGTVYWDAVERGETPQPKREDNAVWDVFKRALRK